MNLDGAGDKPRLTQDQKKKNHIESEKKRREAIRSGFESLSNIIPGTQGQARSEAVVLQRTVEFLKEQVAKKEALWQDAKTRGWSRLEFDEVYRQQDPANGQAEAADGFNAGDGASESGDR